jgi:hypothetical protein
VTRDTGEIGDTGEAGDNILNSALDSLRWRDEILQVMYWYQGEGFGEYVTPRDLVTFMAASEVAVAEHLDRMSDEGYVQREEDDGEEVSKPTRYRLTEWGSKEGGRRFADEFSGLTGQAHGECNNPNCSCQTDGPEACESRVGHTH